MSKLFSKQSKWIWLDETWNPNRYMEAIVPFDAQSEESLHLHISVEGQYAVHLNDEYIPSTQYTDFPFAKSVQIIELNPQPGENMLRIQCWYPGEDTSVTRREAPGLRFELRCGAKAMAVSGETIAVRPIAAYQDGPVAKITGQLGMSFFRRIADEAPWQSAVCVEKETALVPRPICELRVEPCIGPSVVSQGSFQYVGGRDIGEKMQTAGLFWQDIRTMTGGDSTILPLHFTCGLADGVYILLDMGQLYEGYLTLDITCPEKTLIDVGFGEHTQDLRLRTSVGGRCFGATVDAGPERRRFVHYFKRLGCRYIQLFIHSREATIHEAGIQPVYYPVDEKPCMTISDPLHNRIAAISRQTLLACMHEHYEDCPWREQALYAFDSRNQMLAGYYAFGEFPFARENLRLLAHSQREDCLLELCAPARIPITIPSFSMAFIMALEEYCRYSSDLDFGREMLPVCERILDTLAANVHDNLAWRLEDPKYWNFYEWQPMLDGYGDVVLPSAEAGLQLFGLLALQRMRALKGMLGADNRECDLTTEKSLEMGLEQFWNEDEQAYASFIRNGQQVHYAELIQSLALYANVCPTHRQLVLREKLLRGGLVPVTLSYSLFKYEALLQEPANTKAVFDEIAARWGSMLFQGATTFWEVDEGAPAFSRAGSLCHGWSAIPLYLYGAYGLGVRPDASGEWKTFTALGSLKIDAVLRSPKGYLHAEHIPE